MPFPVQTGSRISATTFFCHHFYRAWTYAVWISKIRLLVLRIWAKSFFPSKPEVDFQWQQFSEITSIELEHIPFKFRKSVHKYSGYEPKPCFSRSFSIFLAKPKVDFQNERWSALFCIKLKLLAFKFWKSVHWLSSYVDSTLWHTDIHTYIQTYIHTDRQTEPNYYIEATCFLFIS